MKNLQFAYIDSDIQISDLIFEGRGVNYLKEQIITFKGDDDNEYCFVFDMKCKGDITLKYGTVDISNIDAQISLISSFINGDEVSLSNTDKQEIIQLIKRHLI
jgi:hypothetical protein